MRLLVAVGVDYHELRAYRSRHVVHHPGVRDDISAFLTVFFLQVLAYKSALYGREFAQTARVGPALDVQELDVT